MASVKLIATMTVEYWADPLHYGTDVPKAMAQIDESAINNGECGIHDLISDNATVLIAVVPA
jgi:hypothetical protein